MAVLLAAGPVSTHLTVKNMSATFNMGVSKAKFLSAAKQLQEANLGSVVILDKISRASHVFVKRPPVEARQILELPQNAGYCSYEEYEKRYDVPMPTTITAKMRECLNEQGLLPQGLVTSTGEGQSTEVEMYQSAIEDVHSQRQVDMPPVPHMNMPPYNYPPS